MLLSINNLSVKDRQANYVEDVSLSLEEGQTLALVGQSGSGKTLTALAVMGILPTGFKAEGTIFFNKKNLLKLTEEEKRLLRGSQISYTLQNIGALNPALKIKRQLIEKGSTLTRIGAAKLMQEVGLETDVLNLYPHQLSGGMRQRILIAIALAQNPKILIADEPTSGLDTTVASQILDLLDDLRAKKKLSMILITHDLGIAVNRADKIAVMLDGRIVESGSVKEVLNNRRHPFTKALFNSCVQASGAINNDS